MVRVLTGVTAALLTLITAWAGSYWWLGFIFVLLGIASIEWARLGAVSQPLLFVNLLIAMTFITLRQWTLLPLVIILPTVPLLYYQDPNRGKDAVWSAAGILWLAFPAGLIYFIRLEFGLDALLVILLATIIQDSFAYYTGYLLGGETPFTPQLSPNKTWAGFFGGFLGMVGVIVAGCYYMNWPLWVSVAGGVLLALVGQAGDLSISALKRRIDAEETGAVFPGHGGILDRTDSLVFNVAVFYPLCRLIENTNVSALHHLVWSNALS